MIPAFKRWSFEASPLSDADLLRGAQGGDADAWRTLHERYLPSVWRQAYALTADAHVAEDVTSETMLALLRGIHELNADGAPIAAWLRTVVHRKAMDHHRQAFRRRASLGTSPDSPNQCAAPDARHPLEIAETCDAVHEALEGVSDRQRLVLQWKYVDDLSIREMAERLGETEKAVESTLYRARREFRRLFQIDGVGATAGPAIGLPARPSKSQGTP